VEVSIGTKNMTVMHKALIAYDTARNDLLDLVERGLLVKEIRGKAYIFSVSDKIVSHLGN
jgi:hypothetical protein